MGEVWSKEKASEGWATHLLRLAWRSASSCDARRFALSLLMLFTGLWEGGDDGACPTFGKSSCVVFQRTVFILSGNPGESMTSEWKSTIKVHITKRVSHICIPFIRDIPRGNASLHFGHFML